MEENFYNNYYIFNTNYISRLLSILFILIWGIYFIISQPKAPNQKIQFINQFISSRGIGLGFVIISMFLEIFADLLTIKDNSGKDVENFIPHLGLSTLILWNFSLATKSIAIFIALARYSPITSDLSKEPIMSEHVYNFSIYFNLLSGIMVYPSLVCVLVLYKTTWSQSLMITQVYYVFQMTICLVFFLILNRRMITVMDEGLLYRHAIQPFRSFIPRNFFLIGFLAFEVFSLSIFDLNRLAGNFIQRSFLGTAIVFGFTILSSSAVYIIAIIILSPHFAGINPDNNSNLPNGQNHTLSDFTDLTGKNESKNSKTSGFTSIGIKSFLVKHNTDVPLSNYALPNNREDFVDVELGGDDKGSMKAVSIKVDVSS